MTASIDRRVRVARWDEETIRQALSEFVDGWDRWPTCEEFALGGAKGLREVIGRLHGPAWWAREMGLPDGDRPLGGVRRWTDERIHATLAEFFGDRSTWPTSREFDEAGLHSLREALRHYGGPARWSHEMGVSWAPGPRRSRRREPPSPLPTPSQRPWPKWTEDTITVELGRFLMGRRDWPRHADFVAAGRKGLYHAVLKHGGTHAWADRMGFLGIDRRGGRRWTETRVREGLAAFLTGRDVWPTRREFIAEGHRALFDAARRSGGIERWRRQFELRRSPQTVRAPGERRRASTRERRWTDARIEEAIGPLVDRLGRWPTKREFRHAGLSNALKAAYEHGGSARWQARFGVTAPQPIGPLVDRHVWTKQQIETELHALCVRCGGWPTRSAFDEAGKRSLYAAMSETGGVRYWQTRLSTLG
jgi:hypothetical protein